MENIKGVCKFSVEVVEQKVIFLTEYIDENNKISKLELELNRVSDNVEKQIIKLIKEIKKSGGL